MFDIGFAELLLIAVVGLVVIGPKRLPETIRFVALWLGRIRRSFASAKTEFEREFGVDDIRRELHNETVMRELETAQQSIKQTLEEPVIQDDNPTPSNKKND